MFVMRKYIWCYLWINNVTSLQHEKRWYHALISLHFFFRLTIDRLENEKKEIQHELHIYKQQSSGTQVNIGGDYDCDIRLKKILVLEQGISIERHELLSLKLFQKETHTAQIMAEKNLLINMPFIMRCSLTCRYQVMSSPRQRLMTGWWMKMWKSKCNSGQ